MVRLLLVAVLLLWASRVFGYTCPTGPQQFYIATNPDTCAAPVASGTYPPGSPPQITGFSAANTPEAETVSKDCTFARTGANAYSITCTTAGGGTGDFQVGRLGVGIAAGGVSGDIFANDGLAAGLFSIGAGSPGAGNIVIDNFLLCNEASNASVDCLRANNGLATSSLISITGVNAFQFGSSTGPGISLVSSNSVSFSVGSTIMMNVTVSGVSIPNGLAGGLKLTSGSLLSMTGGTKPTCSSTTGTCTTAVGSTDNRGKMTLSGGTAVTTLTLTFNHLFPQPPFCNFVDCNASTSPVAFSTGAVNTGTAIVDFASVSSTVVCYQCF